MKYPPHAVSREPAVTTIVRHAKQMWPFVFGFACTSYLFIKVAGGVTEEDVKNSKFVNPKH